MDTKEYETTHLKNTLVKMKEVLEEEKIRLDKLYQRNMNDDSIISLIMLENNYIKNLIEALEKPYFARIDFKYIDNDKYISFYIGRHGVSQDDNVIVTDWRAPISSLYYDSEVGECKFDSPRGTEYGNMSLKRQFEIERGELLNYFDVNLVTDDVLLQRYLNENNDNRLKSIVATIQHEQNIVIRMPLNNNIIVQGVAGSGKTTVALHRIAYLVYNYINQVKQNQYMIIGPNPVFLRYIESVLPELDVASACEFTFEEFSKSYINENIIINDSSNKANNYIDKNVNNNIDGFKNSLKYKKMLDLFINDYINNILQKDLMIDKFVVIPHNIINEMYKSTSDKYDEYVRINQTVQLLNRYIEDNQNKILLKYNKYMYDLFDVVDNASEKELIKKSSLSGQREIKNNCKNIVKKYFFKTKALSSKIYKEFINNVDNYNFYNYDDIYLLKKNTLNNVKKGIYDFEDLASLVYLKRILNPNKEYKNYRHVVIDEAQDLGEFDFKVLKDVFENATFSIFGDLAQSIYDYRSINDWDRVNEIMFNNKSDIINFNKSYRTTREIMNIANSISERLKIAKSDLVIRSGKEVKFSRLDSQSKLVDYIISKIKEYKKSNYKTIAIISKTEDLSKKMNEQLASKGLVIPNITMNDDVNDEKFNICTISNYLAKGLEFDAVILNNISDELYSMDNSLDLKLLYVAITRALHELDITYTKKLTKSLIDFDKQL